MRVLLNTNVIIYREAQRIIVEKIGLLFYWFNKLHFTKYIHPATVEEINKPKNDLARD